MMETRRVVSLALEARAKAGIKVRQPLQKLVVRVISLQSKKECLDLIADEVNVKEIAFDSELLDEVALDTKITDDLREEGNLRELIRFIQELRKKSGLKPGELATLWVSADSVGENFVKKFATQIKKTALLSKISFETDEKNTVGEIEIDRMEFKINIQKT